MYIVSLIGIDHVVIYCEELCMLQIWQVVPRHENIDIQPKFRGTVVLDSRAYVVSILLADPLFLCLFHPLGPALKILEFFKHLWDVLADIEVPLIHHLPLDFGA